MSYKRYFVAFGDTALKDRAVRMRAQAEAMQAYDGGIYIFDENGLDKDFRERFDPVLSRKYRGFGYWCWKPQVVLQVLEKMQDGDIVHYSDIGCHLVPEGRSRLMEYFDMAERALAGMVCVQHHWYFPEALWTKGDLLDHFGARGDRKVYGTGQYLTTTFLVRKSDATVAFIRRWLSMFMDHYSLIDDTPSRSRNMPGFMENRHDQSVFSLMCKQAGVTGAVSFAECFPVYIDKAGVPHGRDGRIFPVWEKWDRDLKPKTLWQRIAFRCSYLSLKTQRRVVTYFLWVMGVSLAVRFRKPGV